MEEAKEREREKGESVRVSRHLSRGHTCRALLESRKGDSPTKSNPYSYPHLLLRVPGGTLKRDKLEPPFRTKPTLSVPLFRVSLRRERHPPPPFPFFLLSTAPRFDNGVPPMIPRFSLHLSPSIIRGIMLLREGERGRERRRIAVGIYYNFCLNEKILSGGKIRGFGILSWKALLFVGGPVSHRASDIFDNLF